MKSILTLEFRSFDELSEFVSRNLTIPAGMTAESVSSKDCGEAVFETKVSEELAEVAEKKSATFEDVHKAFRAYADKNGVEKAKELISKKLKLKTIKDLKPEQYETALELVS